MRDSIALSIQFLVLIGVIAIGAEFVSIQRDHQKQLDERQKWMKEVEFYFNEGTADRLPRDAFLEWQRDFVKENNLKPSHVKITPKRKFPDPPE